MSIFCGVFPFQGGFSLFLRGPSFFFTLVVYVEDSLGYVEIWEDPLIGIFPFLAL